MQGLYGTAWLREYWIVRHEGASRRVDRQRQGRYWKADRGVTFRRERLAYLNAKYGPVQHGEWGEEWFANNEAGLRRLLDIPTTQGTVQSLEISGPATAGTETGPTTREVGPMAALAEFSTRPLRLVR